MFFGFQEFAVTYLYVTFSEEFHLHYAHHFDKEVSEVVRKSVSAQAPYLCDLCVQNAHANGTPIHQQKSYQTFEEVRNHYVMMHGKLKVRELINEKLLKNKNCHNTLSLFRLERGVFLPPPSQLKEDCPPAMVNKRKSSSNLDEVQAKKSRSSSIAENQVRE